MYKVYETVHSDMAEGIEGNYLAACVASILNMSLKDVELGLKASNVSFKIFMEEHGCAFAKLVDVKSITSIKDREQIIKDAIQQERKEAKGIDGEYFIVVGLGKRGVHHACVYNEHGLVHDPNRAGKGLIRMDYMWVFHRAPLIAQRNPFENSSEIS